MLFLEQGNTKMTQVSAQSPARLADFCAFLGRTSIPTSLSTTHRDALFLESLEEVGASVFRLSCMGEESHGRMLDRAEFEVRRLFEIIASGRIEFEIRPLKNLGQFL